MWIKLYRSNRFVTWRSPSLNGVPTMIKIYPSWFIFLFLNLLGVSLILSTANWFIAWIGLELTLLGFLPITLANNTAIESLVKYLLIQAGGSSLFLFAVLNTLKPELTNVLIIIRMLIKIGLFPFFQWVPVVIRTLPWIRCLVLTTLQKLGPIFLVINFQLNTIKILLLSRTTRILIRGLLGLNQTKIRPLIAYSSISHTRWILSSVPFRALITTIYTIVYFWLNTVLFINLRKLNINNLISSVNSQKESLTILIRIIVLSGIPPFSIFFIKLAILSYLTLYPILAITTIFGAIMSSYFYLTIVIPNLTKPLNKKNIFFKRKPSLFILAIPSFMIPVIITI